MFPYWATVNLIIRNNILRKGIYKFPPSVTLNVRSSNAQQFFIQKWLRYLQRNNWQISTDSNANLLVKKQPMFLLFSFCSRVNVQQSLQHRNLLASTSKFSLPFTTVVYRLLTACGRLRIFNLVDPQTLNITHTPWNSRKSAGLTPWVPWIR